MPRAGTAARRAAEPVLSLEVQARMAELEPEASVPFRVLVRHFLNRFFNNEMTSPDGEGMRRLIQVACAVGLPGFIMTIYLYPTYHLPRHHLRPYWLQVGDHYFYAVYSFVAMGIVTIFEWDFFFPHLLDTFVLTPLPIKNGWLFRARIAAIAIFVAGFLFDSNFLAPMVLPAATDARSLWRLEAAHIAAVALSGIFAAALVLSLQSLIVSILGETAFRKVSLPLQGCGVTGLLLLLFLSPATADTLKVSIGTPHLAALWFPPFWFLGIYQRILEGPAVLPVFAQLSHISVAATAAATTMAVLCYPFAYWRKTRQIVEGRGSSVARVAIAGRVSAAIDQLLLREPMRIAMWRFIGQTLLRVQRYRIYLVMYGGLGVALVSASVLRFAASQGQLRLEISADGLRAAVPIVAFWTIAGLRSCFLAPSDRQGMWVFRIIRGRPDYAQLVVAKHWALICAGLFTSAVVILGRNADPVQFSTWRIESVQWVTTTGLCVLLADIFFFPVRTIPFTGTRPKPATYLAVVLMQYLGLFPVLIAATLRTEAWMEAAASHIVMCIATIVGLHAALRFLHRREVAEHLQLIDVDEDQEEFPQTLGLRF